MGRLHPLTRTFQRALSWHVAAGVLWMIGGLLGGARYVLWALALAANLGAPLTGYYIPGLGRSRTEEWTVAGAHLAARCRLFVLIALGESLLVTGATFGETEASAAAVSALVLAFLSSVALWWIYFNRSAEAASDPRWQALAPPRLRLSLARAEQPRSH